MDIGVRTVKPLKARLYITHRHTRITCLQAPTFSTWRDRLFSCSDGCRAGRGGLGFLYGDMGWNHCAYSCGWPCTRCPLLLMLVPSTQRNLLCDGVALCYRTALLLQRSAACGFACLCHAE